MSIEKSAVFVTTRKEAGEDLTTVEKHLNAKVSTVSSILELCNHLATADAPTHLVVFDEQILFENSSMSVFDITNLVQNFAKASKQTVIPTLSAYVDAKTSAQHIEQLLDTEIKGFVPSIALFGVDETVVALAELLSNRLNMPRKLVDYYLNPHKTKSTRENDIVLTRRQSQILHLITTRGASNKVIARHLKISESTVKLHIGAILKKYGVRNRTQLALCSLGNGRL